MVKKKENSKRTYNDTKKIMKACRKQEEAREHKQKRKWSVIEPFVNARKQTNKWNEIFL